MEPHVAHNSPFEITRKNENCYDIANTCLLWKSSCIYGHEGLAQVYLDICVFRIGNDVTSCSWTAQNISLRSVLFSPTPCRNSCKLFYCLSFNSSFSHSMSNATPLLPYLAGQFFDFSSFSILCSITRIGVPLLW